MNAFYINMVNVRKVKRIQGVIKDEMKSQITKYVKLLTLDDKTSRIE